VAGGATPEGKKELLGFQVGMRESAKSWRKLLIDLKARGLTIAPELATGDGLAWLLEGARGGVAGHSAPTLHRAQDRQRARQAAQICPARGQGRPTPDLGGAGPCHR
jgi:hypothetical protein